MTIIKRMLLCRSFIKTGNKKEILNSPNAIGVDGRHVIKLLWGKYR